jgi:hypothetical protein
MIFRASRRHSLAMALAFGVATVLAGCGSKDPAVATPPPAATTAPAAPAAAPAPVTAAEVGSQTWTPEALEDLLAPVALYPDPVLSQVLIASTNPQEVLDAGNWLIANDGLTGKALDDAAAQVGFTPPIRALVQFPQTVDMMAMEMGWTTELGQAFVADQPGVLDAVQRLRRQAVDVGNLQTSDAMRVETKQQEGQDVILLKPAQPGVVSVPTYDPQAVYAPLPTTAATTAATTTTVEDKTKYSTGNMVTTGLLAFGAGILVNELFDDDDNNRNRYDYYYPNYGYGGMPYYPPYPYRPNYGNGYYPSSGYNRPPNYNNGFQNNGNIIITNPGNGGGYWDRYPNRPGSGQPGYGGYQKQPRQVASPITAARPSRPELTKLNQRQPRPMPADYKRPAEGTTAANWKGQSTYAGKNKRPANATRTPQERIAEAQPGYSRPASANKGGSKAPPKVQGSYAGKDRMQRPQTPSANPATRDMQKPGTRDVQRPQTRDMQKPSQRPQTRELQKAPPNKSMPAGDRGYNSRDMQRPSPKPSAEPAPMNRPSPGMQSGGKKGNKGTAMSGAGGNRNSASAASQRGKQSMPQGAGSKGGNKGKKKAR